MSRVLFVTWDGGGNVPPLLGIAAELHGRGHHIRVIGDRVQEAKFRAFGLDFAAHASSREFRAAAGASVPALLGHLGDRGKGRNVAAALAAEPADVVVVDCLLFGVMDVLRKADIPYVALEHSLDGYLRRAARGPLGLMLRLRGLRPLQLLDSGSPTIVCSLAELDPGHGDVVHTGPVVTGTPAAAPEPTVLVSLSTFRFRGLHGTWQRVLDAVDGLQARVVATTGPAVDPATLRVPSNVELHSWLPHDELMPSVSMVITHGGHATAMAALAHDLPMLVLPVDAKTDQPFMGRVLERSGAARTMGRRSSPADIRTAVEGLLEEGPHRDAAARLGRTIRELDGRRRGADLVESVVGRR
jgi:UDP:flavonoid glycosyltransferase YjiC (YdhE family)